MQSEKRVAFWVVVSLIAFVLVVLGFVLYMNIDFIFENNNLSTLNLPVITTYNTSETTGESTEVKVNLALGGSDEALSKVQELDYINIVLNSIQEIDYDILASDSGRDTIKKEVELAINKNMDKHAISDVYIYGLDIGLTNSSDFIQDDVGDDTEARRKQLESLFGN